MTITDAQWRSLIDARINEPTKASELLRRRKRRSLLRDGQLFIVAADHPARGMLGVGDDPFAMADRRKLLNALLVALSHEGCDGVLGSADVIDELALLGALDDKLVFGTMNRGGIMGASWELDDRMTAYRPIDIAQRGLDGGKVLLRLANDDAGTAPTLEACARVVTEMADLGMPIMVEPLPYRGGLPGPAKMIDDNDLLVKAVSIASGLGSSSARTWLKVPATSEVERMMAATTLPGLILGGAPGPDPEATFASWERSMRVPNVRGLVVGRALLFPADGDVASAVDRAARIVRPTL
ncbi:MAG: aldolase [Actinobacteria bacterium]|nr:aldolase [Actinomycetota bacterium]